MVVRVPFPGLGNSVKLEVPVRVTSGIDKPWATGKELEATESDSPPPPPPAKDAAPVVRLRRHRPAARDRHDALPTGRRRLQHRRQVVVLDLRPRERVWYEKGVAVELRTSFRS